MNVADGFILWLCWMVLLTGFMLILQGFVMLVFFLLDFEK